MTILEAIKKSHNKAMRFFSFSSKISYLPQPQLQPQLTSSLDELVDSANAEAANIDNTATIVNTDLIIFFIDFIFYC